MTDWIVVGVLVAGFLFTYRRAYLALMSVEENRDWGSGPDREDRAMTAMLAMLLSLMWPLVILGWILWRFVTPVTPGQRKAELDEREARIAQMERELGIGRGGR